MRLTAIHKVLATSALICAMGAANAAIGTTTLSTTLAAGSPFSLEVSGGSFNDVLKFTSPLSDILVDIAFDYSGSTTFKYDFAEQTGASLESFTTKVGASGSKLYSFTYHLLDNTPYQLGVIGKGGITNFSMTVSALPVPEPETYAMLLVGMGLMGVIAQRRKQTGL